MPENSSLAEIPIFTEPKSIKPKERKAKLKMNIEGFLDRNEELESEQPLVLEFPKNEEDLKLELVEEKKENKVEPVLESFTEIVKPEIIEPKIAEPELESNPELVNKERETALTKFHNLLEKIRNKVNFYGFGPAVVDFFNGNKDKKNEDVVTKQPILNPRVSELSAEEQRLEKETPRRQIFDARSKYENDKELNRLDTFLGNLAKIKEENKLMTDEEFMKYLSLIGFSPTMFESLVFSNIQKETFGNNLEKAESVLKMAKSLAPRLFESSNLENPRNKYIKQVQNKIAAQNTDVVDLNGYKKEQEMKKVLKVA